MSLESVLASMTYKPTYEFELKEQLLTITMHTHDARPDEAPPLSIPVDFPLPDFYMTDTGYGMSDHGWRLWLREKIRWCEMHESDEWLRFDGKLYRDPHEEAMFR